MSEEKKPLNPCDLFLPKDYEDNLEYRQSQPEINTDTSDDDDDRQNPDRQPLLTRPPTNPLHLIPLHCYKNI
jgi:hypothetical protein